MHVNIRIIRSTHLFSAIIEHTNRVIYLEDNDVAAVTENGGTLFGLCCHSYSLKGRRGVWNTYILCASSAPILHI